ncbi:ETC complex I subunit [Nordella sp. HKS 07]|uniref:ETC complex I subunit n=1 Tax=Nordella sp. HKS 07 TaxID=2712222 RepID=UPI0013E14C01|nr:ETC complex I subunit [Nordella sp. HKS 07]QIG50982.1 ETC complex I subunit [Nordella sp. HKS 07]
MTAKIYKPARNAMQSGKGKTDLWLLEYEPELRLTADPLMGWTSSADMKQQLRLTFESKEQAIAYAERNGIAYWVEPEAPARAQRKSYADNFKWGRTETWTH